MTVVTREKPMLVYAGLTLAMILGSAPAEPQRQATPSEVIPVGGCHSGWRTHFVPEAGRSVRHRHRADCSPVLSGDEGNRSRRQADCHRDVRTHRIGGVMVTHRHVGNDCAIREVRRSKTVVPD